ncbi:stage II sporulation protein P [Bacillus sp. FSL W7-1360]
MRHGMRFVTVLVIAMMTLFLCTSMIVALGPQHYLSSSTLKNWTSGLKGEHFLQWMSTENRMFAHGLPEEAETLSLGQVLFQMTTSINTDDPRSLLGRELPGFSLFDTKIHIAGEGTDYTNLPIESPPPDDLLASDREATKQALEKKKALEEEGKNKASLDQETPTVYIGASHTYESFFPELELDDGTVADNATHREINITMTAERLKQALAKHGIAAQVEQQDVQATLVERGLNYRESYNVAREFIQAAKEENKELHFFFDLHRDSVGREMTTTEINGDTYARTFFVVGTNYADYAPNLAVAESLHNMLEEQYPTLSRGVFTKGGANTNGKFNQDLAENSILMEVGGVDNSLEETYRAVEAVAEVFAEYYAQQFEGGS